MSGPQGQSAWAFFVAGCIRQWPIIVTSTGFAAAGLLVVLDHVRVGCLVTVISLFVAAGLRATLPHEALGVLVVRSRATDVFMLLAWATLLGVIALPEPSLWGH